MTSYATLYLPRTLASAVDDLAASDPSILRDAALRFLVLLVRLQRGGLAFVNLHSSLLRATVHRAAMRRVIAPLVAAGVIERNGRYRKGDPARGVRGSPCRTASRPSS